MGLIGTPMNDKPFQKFAESYLFCAFLPLSLILVLVPDPSFSDGVGGVTFIHSE